MTLEVITLGLEDTLEAEKYGADRVELVSEMAKGGLTPSKEVIGAVLKTAKIPAQIMVRPHDKSFVYDASDWREMAETIEMIRELGGKRIVIGAMTEAKEIDQVFLERLIDFAPEFDITFHRAFDEVEDQIAAYHILRKYKQIKRILTSGGQATASEGQEVLRNLVELSETTGGPEILVGSGVSPSNLASLKKIIGAKAYHIGSAVRLDRDFTKGIDQRKVKRALEIIQ